MYQPQKKEKEKAPNNRPVARGQTDGLWPEGRGPDGARRSGPKSRAARIPTLHFPGTNPQLGIFDHQRSVSSFLGELEGKGT